MLSLKSALTASASAAILSSAGLAQSGLDRPLRHVQEFRASTYAPSAQEEAALAVAPDGSFGVVWSSRRQREGRYGVYLQRFGADGVASGAETPLALWPESHAMAPVLGFTRDGGAWAAWQSSGQDGWGNAVIARFIDTDGAGGSEILVNERPEGEQRSPVLAPLADGGVAIAWTTSLPGDTERVAFRVFNADGSPRTGETTVDPAPGVRTGAPSVAPAANGGFALAYTAFDAETGEAAGVLVQAFGADGRPEADPVRVSPEGALTPVEPALAAAGDGFIVAWQDVAASEHNYDAFAALVDACGRLTVGPVLVNTDRTGLQNAAAPAVAPDGCITIAFNGRDQDGLGVFARDFDADLRPLGPERRLTSRVHGEQAMRDAAGTQRLAFTPAGALLCAWEGDSGFGDSSSVNVTLQSPVPGDLGRRTAGVTPAMAPAPHGGVVALAGGPEPHDPPTFDPRDIDEAEREVLRTRSGIGFTGVVNTGWTPPDPHLAVGPDHVVLMTNGEISFFTKDGTRTFQDEIEDSFGFWGSVGATGFVFDPEVLYDTTSGRFIAMAAEAFAPGDRSYCLVAVSDDSDPNGTWYKYRFDTTSTSGNLFDSPNIGVTDNAVVITGDGFGFGARYPVYIFDKASLLAGDPPAVSNSFLLPTSTQSAGYPRVTVGTGDTLYLLEHREAFNSNTTVRVLAFSDILGTPDVSEHELTVPAYGAPEDPPQRGTSSRPNTFDARFWSVDQGPDGSLWATHHVNPNKVVARWYQIDLQGWPFTDADPVLVQSGDIDLGTDIRTFFSSINVSTGGVAAICYSRSAPNEFISMGTSFRNPCDTPGFFTVNEIHRESNAGYTAGRWGDYSAVQFDPVQFDVYWAHHEYAENNSWRTWVQSVDTGDPCIRADINADGAVNTTDVLEFLNAWNGGECIGDWNRDGSFDILDALAFLNDWVNCRT